MNIRNTISMALATTAILLLTACNGSEDDTSAPVFSSITTVSVEENQLSAITLSASDTTTVTYSISESDADFFDINATSGVVTFKVAPDYEDYHNGDNTYSFTATATDTSGNVSTQSITISILNLITHNGFSYGEVVSPYTAKIWLDRNLGASQVCTDHDDAACYGNHYQWGRNTDGHQLSDANTTTTQATNINAVGHGSYIITVLDTYQHDWALQADGNGSLRSANWSKTDGSSVCPIGFRVPTIQELRDETLDSNTPVITKIHAHTNFLKFPSPGDRYYTDGSIANDGIHGVVWSSDPSGSDAHALYFDAEKSFTYDFNRASGFVVRCIKD